MRIAYITAGAASMYCGSCLHDNALASALLAQGHEVSLVPVYTPIRTDESDVSVKRVFFGGINIYLQEKSALFRHTPWFLDRLWDTPRLLRWVSRFAVATRADELGPLVLSMLHGEHGHQRKELDKLLWWLERDVQPVVVNLSTCLLAGMAREIRRRLGVPVISSLSGEDLFLEGLVEPYRREALAALRSRVRDVDGFIAFNKYFAGFMSEYLEIPQQKVHVVPLGVNVAGHEPAGGSRTGVTIGYLARIAPEKGLHLLAEAWRKVQDWTGRTDVRLSVAGYLSGRDRRYFDEIQRQIERWGLGERFDYVGEVDRAGKLRFLQGLDVFSVPTVYRESKGRSVLEAMASGVPVIVPRHGTFPEMIQATQGGLLVEPGDTEDLARGLERLVSDEGLRGQLARQGRDAVQRRFTAASMAEGTVAVYRKYLAASAEDRGLSGKATSVAVEV